MKYRRNRPARLLALTLAVALMLSGTALSEGYEAIVTSKRMPVAADAWGSRMLGSLGKFSVVTVLETLNGVARISYKGRTGYARASDFIALDSIATKAVTNRLTWAFRSPDIRSARVQVAMGTAVNILAVKGQVAMVERGGMIAYMLYPHLTPQSDGFFPGGSVDPEPQQPQPPSLQDAWQSGRYSNEQICFLFLTQVMGYNTAAASGVLANLYYESSFNPDITGDGGTSYGICQWHSSRRTRLEDFCVSRGLTMNTLPAQLLFLQYELENFYPKVHRYMQGVNDDALGAYDAAYYFCYNYEGPASKVTQSVKRGTKAQETYYPKYAGV